MADEAVVRIVLQDQSGSGGGATSGAGTGAPTPPAPKSPSAPPASSAQSAQAAAAASSAAAKIPYTPMTGRFSPRISGEFDPYEEARKRRKREEMLQQVDEAYHKLYPEAEQQTDPAVEAQRRLDTEKRRAAIEVEYAKLNPPAPPPTAYELALKRLQAEKDREEIEVEYLKLNPPPPPPTAYERAVKRLQAEKDRQEMEVEYAKLNPPPPPPTTAELARKRLDAEIHRQEIEAEYRKLNPLPPPPTAYELALKRLQAEKDRQEVEAEYRKLKPPEPFDPIADAQKRRERERKSALTNAAYRDQYGDEDGKTPLSRVLDVANRFRGTIGGLAGVVIGATLDVVESFRKAAQDAAKKRKEAQLISELQTYAPRFSRPTLSGAGPLTAPPKYPTLGNRPGGGKTQGSTTQQVDSQDAAGAAATAGSQPTAAATTAPTKATPPPLPTTGSAAADAATAGAGAVGAGGNITDAALSAANSLASIAPVAGAVTVGLVAMVKVIGAIIDEADRLGEKFADYNPQVAAAQAQIEIAKEMQTLRQANNSSGEFARYVIAKGDLDMKWNEIKVKLMTKVVALITPVLEVIGALLDSGSDIGSAISGLLGPLNNIASSMGTVVGMQKDDRSGGYKDPTDLLLHGSGPKVPEREGIRANFDRIS